MKFKTVSTKNASHYNWAKGCEGWHHLESENLSVIEEKMAPKTSEVKHYHKNSEQLFYILQGVATMILENDTIIINVGESLNIPKMQIHQLKNDTDEELHFLVISSPKSHGDKVII